MALLLLVRAVGPTRGIAAVLTKNRRNPSDGYSSSYLGCGHPSRKARKCPFEKEKAQEALSEVRVAVAAAMRSTPTATARFHSASSCPRTSKGDLRVHGGYFRMIKCKRPRVLSRHARKRLSTDRSCCTRLSVLWTRREDSAICSPI